MYNIGNILSIGDLENSLSLICKPNSNTRTIGMRIQSIIFISTYATGSLAAPAALWSVVDFNKWSIPLGVFLYIGQITLFTLQTNERIYTSIFNMKSLFHSLTRRTICNRDFLCAFFMTIANTTYRGITFNYIAATFIKLFTNNIEIIRPFSILFVLIGGYFTLSTQGVDQLLAAINMHHQAVLSQTLTKFCRLNNV